VSVSSPQLERYSTAEEACVGFASRKTSEALGVRRDHREGEYLAEGIMVSFTGALETRNR
jgi:hypothetical protein